MDGGFAAHMAVSALVYGVHLLATFRAIVAVPRARFPVFLRLVLGDRPLLNVHDSLLVKFVFNLAKNPAGRDNYSIWL